VIQGVEHDEAISIYALAMLARRLLCRPAIAGLRAMTIPRFFNSPEALGHGGAEFGKV
jgi:hypothetical protein